jgi:hypothetical protein
MVLLLEKSAEGMLFGAVTDLFCHASLKVGGGNAPETCEPEIIQIQFRLRCSDVALECLRHFCRHTTPGGRGFRSVRPPF